MIKFWYKEFICLMKINPFLRVWCGYVQIPPSHPLYEKEYDSLCELGLSLDVHGGITYSAFGIPGLETESHSWWIGFDCAHAGDHVPGFDGEEVPTSHLTFKTPEYVKNELQMLVDQLKEMEKQHVKDLSRL